MTNRDYLASVELVSKRLYLEKLGSTSYGSVVSLVQNF